MKLSETSKLFLRFFRLKTTVKYNIVASQINLVGTKSRWSDDNRIYGKYFFFSISPSFSLFSFLSFFHSINTDKRLMYSVITSSLSLSLSLSLINICFLFHFKIKHVLFPFFFYSQQKLLIRGSDRFVSYYTNIIDTIFIPLTQLLLKRYHYQDSFCIK